MAHPPAIYPSMTLTTLTPVRIQGQISGPAVEAPGGPKVSYTSGAAAVDFTEIQPETSGFSNPLYGDIGGVTADTGASASNFREIKPDTAGFSNPLYGSAATEVCQYCLSNL